MSKSYKNLIPWFELEAFIKEKLASHYFKLGKAKGEDVPQLQGKVQELQELLGLPEVLAARAEEEEARKNAIT